MTPIQLDIIRTFGKKELSFGCIIMGERVSKIIGIDYERSGFYRMIDDGENTYSGNINGDEILGHIPELFPDVARVAKEKGWLFSYQSEKLTFYGLPGPHFIPYNPTLPLLDQEESTLVQLLNLFK